jgi:hypothetical protein
MAILIYSPIKSIQQFPFLHMLTSICYFVSMIIVFNYINYD